MFRVDLTGATGQAVAAMNLGTRLDNKTDFGKGYLHHLVHYDPEIGAMDDLGVFAVKNPDFFSFSAGPACQPVPKP